MDLSKLGWNDYFEKNSAEYRKSGNIAGRVITKQINSYTVISEEQVYDAKVSGSFRYHASQSSQYPAVGDWVVLEKKDSSEFMYIRAVLPRKSSFVRKLPISGGRKLKKGVISGGLTEEQVICSNIDIAFIVTGLDQNFDLRRIERYITLAHNSGAAPVILLNKADLCDSVSDHVRQVESVAVGKPVHPISVLKQMGLDIFERYLLPGKTVVFLGSSGVGKSTIINYLLGTERQKTNEVSAVTGKGRHTTNRADLILHDNGSMIIDTPGLRELQLWGTQEALEQSFEDIIDLAVNCKYRDCTHTVEPGCAVKKAIEDGEISIERFDSYEKQLQELGRLDGKIMQHEKYLTKKEILRMKQKYNN